MPSTVFLTLSCVFYLINTAATKSLKFYLLKHAHRSIRFKMYSIYLTSTSFSFFSFFELGKLRGRELEENASARKKHKGELTKLTKIDACTKCVQSECNDNAGEQLSAFSRSLFGSLCGHAVPLALPPLMLLLLRVCT